MADSLAPAMKGDGVMNAVLQKIIIGCVIVLFALGPVACEKEGTAEKAGKKVDETVESVKEKVKEATD